MRARFLLTDRHLAGGASTGPYAAANLGSHVGDDPAAVLANRAALAAQVGVPSARLAFMNQVHGRAVATVEPAGLTRLPPTADALVSRTRGVGLVVLVADCVPVLLAGHDASGPVAVAVAHAGRSGMTSGVVPGALGALVELGAVAGRTTALVGPAVCAACYEVPGELADHVAAVVPEARATSRRGTPALDVRAGVLAQLRAAGVTDVEVDPRCTRESPELYSYRRDGVTGRFGGVAWLEP